jgi:hypothetical protein
VIAQSKGADRTAMLNDPMTSVQASVKTGDLLPHDAAVLALGEKRAEREERKLDISERTTLSRERQADMRDATQRYIADLRHQDSTKRLDALIAKTGAGKDKDGIKDALNFIDGARKELANDAQNTRQLMQAELKDVLDPDEQKRIKSDYADKLAAIERKRTQVEKDFSALRSKVGLPAVEPEPAPKPTPTLPELPKGAKQIGTSGGKPVYETPDGKRFIAK